MVTAAHCVLFGEPDIRYIAKEPSEVVIAYGSLHLDQVKESQRRYVAAITPHARYQRETQRSEKHEPTGMGQMNDIALIILQSPINDFPSIPVLPNALSHEVMAEGRQLIISGYGQISSDRENDDNKELYTSQTPLPSWHEQRIYSRW